MLNLKNFVAFISVTVPREQKSFHQQKARGIHCKRNMLDAIGGLKNIFYIYYEFRQSYLIPRSYR